MPEGVVRLFHCVEVKEVDRPVQQLPPGLYVVMGKNNHPLRAFQLDMPTPPSQVIGYLDRRKQEQQERKAG